MKHRGCVCMQGVGGLWRGCRRERGREEQGGPGDGEKDTEKQDGEDGG